jgi:hypothetical protein
LWIGEWNAAKLMPIETITLWGWCGLDWDLPAGLAWAR